MPAGKPRATLPREVECPECGRMVTVAMAQRAYMQHSIYPTGPECTLSKEPVSAEAIRNTVLRQNARTVLHWAQTLREEDPRIVQRWISYCDRAALENLMIIALAAIPENTSPGRAFDWVTRMETA